MRAFVIGWVCLMGLVSVAAADDVSHRASAERFLKLAKAESMTNTVYEQVDDLMAAQFVRMGGSMQSEHVLRSYQQKAKLELDKELAWEAMRDEVVGLYTAVFTEQELDRLSEFYESKVGTKLMFYLPELTYQSMAVTRNRVEERVAPRIELLIDQMEEAVLDEQTEQP
ncbi:DUF2059 domain-containing protein [Pseudomonas saliphila]|uniref:DUF2059 domain-containing protein n=1 Tax=Pseudomonas saliphila TaxID=2586906 RepID=UPI0015B689CB|nr:DUF2059 domain-containing protein [Pseudomonas saliphila]